MSFEKFEPGEPPRVTEMQQEKDLQNKDDKKDLETKDSWETPHTSSIDIASSQEMNRKNLGDFADKNPEVRPTKDCWPEAIAQAELEVQQKGWPC